MTGYPRYTITAPTINCAIAALDAVAKVAMADFKAAAAKLRDETLTAKRRRGQRMLCREAGFRWNALCYAMTAYPAQSKRGLLAQIRQLGEAALSGDTDRAERFVAVICEGVEGLVPDDDSSADANIETLRAALG